MPTPSPERIQAILEELYALDPSLREYGSDLTEAVEALLAAKPDIRVDPQFAQSLRSRMVQQSETFTPHPSLMEKLTKFFVPAVGVATAAVIIGVVVAQPGLFRLPGSPASTPTQNNVDGLFASGVTITRSGARAFGELATQAGGHGGDASAISFRSQSGGGGPAMGMPMAPMATTAREESANVAVGLNPSVAPVPPTDADSKIMIAPDYTYERIRYVYEGELPELAPSVDVYRRVKKPIDGSTLAGSLRSTSLGVVDLSRFSNANLQQFTLLEPGQYGYQIYVDLNEGMININQNWNTWPRPEASCTDQACFDRYRIKPEDVPSDETLIGTTDAFLAERGISKDAFGAPVVDRRWNQTQPYMRDLPAEELSRMRYVPESITVTYPVKLEGGTAYDQSGFPFGLGVSVDIRSKRVASVWNLAPQQYESSAYDAVTDPKQILDVASRGDVYSGPFGQDPNEKVREVKLGTPERVLMQSWHQTANGMGEEILVPALRFPVIADAEGNNGYREAVVVPLVKELISPIYTIMGGGTGATMLKADPGSAQPASAQAATEPAMPRPTPAPKQ